MSNPDIYRPQVPRRTSRHRIRGVDYAVNEWGDPGHPLLIWLHGWGDCGATLQFVVDAFTRDWFVVAPDFRGFGETRCDAPAFWFPDYLADLDRLLGVYSPGEAVRLVGHSMGGNVGGLYAGAMPERVRAFVNVEGFGLPDTDPAEAPSRYRDWIERGREPPAFASWPDHAALAARIRRENPHTHPAIARYVAHCWAAGADGAVTLRASPYHRLPNPVLYRRRESEACWRRVRAAVLLVAGQDSAVLAALGGRLEANTLPFPAAATQIIERAGHMLHFDAPAALAAAIEGFLAQHL